TGAGTAAGSGQGHRPTAVPDLAWFDADGGPLDHGAWHDPGVRTLQMLRTAPEPGDADVLVVLTGALDPVDVTLPGLRAAAGGEPERWELVWDSDWEHPDDPDRAPGESAARPGAVVGLEALSLRVYVSPTPPRESPGRPR
ncbi:MAG: hypothetical protein ACTIAP_08075, partial [Cellulosimicrobium funkei]